MTCSFEPRCCRSNPRFSKTDAIFCASVLGDRSSSNWSTPKKIRLRLQEDPHDPYQPGYFSGVRFLQVFQVFSLRSVWYFRTHLFRKPRMMILSKDRFELRDFPRSQLLQLAENIGFAAKNLQAKTQTLEASSNILNLSPWSLNQNKRHTAYSAPLIQLQSHGTGQNLQRVPCRLWRLG